MTRKIKASGHQEVRKPLGSARLNPVLELPAGASPWKKIEVLESDWYAFVNFFLSQVETFKTSYNTPGKNDWEAYFAENHPKDYKIYYAAKLAATRGVR